MACRAGVAYILKDSCFVGIAAFLFTDVEPDPAIVAKARRSNVHVLWGQTSWMDRLAEVAASKDCRPSTSEP